MPASQDTLPESSLTQVRERLTTSSVEQPRRLEYWIDTVCSLYCGLDCAPPEEEPIFGSIDINRAGSLALTHLRSNGRHVQRTQSRVRADGNDHCLVLVLREGRAVVRQDGRTAILRPGDFVFNDCTRSYELHFDPPHHDLHVLRVERSALQAHIGNLEDLTSVAVPRQAIAGQLLLPMLDTLHAGIHRMPADSAAKMGDACLSIVGAGLRGLPEAHVQPASGLQAYHRARIRAYLQQHLRSPELCIDTIAQAVQLSPGHVRKLFRDEPVRLSRLIWQMRLDACRKDLTDPRLAARSMTEISFSWGFNDAAHFSRAFRDRYGLPPREWRQQQLAVLPNAGLQ